MRLELTRAITLTLFWVIAALLVAATPVAFDLESAVPIAFVKIAVIVAVAFGYVKISRHLGSLDKALIVGALWLLLDICTDLFSPRRGRNCLFPRLNHESRD